MTSMVPEPRAPSAMAHGLVFHGGVQVLVQEEAEGGAAGLAGLVFVALADAAAVLVDEFPHRHAQVGFDHAGLIDVAHHLEDLGAPGVFGALGLVPFGAVAPGWPARWPGTRRC